MPDVAIRHVRRYSLYVVALWILGLDVSLPVALHDQCQQWLHEYCQRHVRVPSLMTGFARRIPRFAGLIGMTEDGWAFRSLFTLGVRGTERSGSAGPALGGATNAPERFEVGQGVAEPAVLDRQ